MGDPRDVVEWDGEFEMTPVPGTRVPIFLTGGAFTTSDDTEPGIAEPVFDRTAIVRRTPSVRDLDDAVAQDDIRRGDAELDAHLEKTPPRMPDPRLFRSIYMCVFQSKNG